MSGLRWKRVGEVMKRREFLAAMLAIPVAPVAVREIRTITAANLHSMSAMLKGGYKSRLTIEEWLARPGPLVLYVGKREG